MPKLKPKFRLGLEDGEIFMHTNYPPRGEDAEVAGQFLFNIKDIVGKEFPHHKLNFCITAAPLEGDVYWYFPAAPLTSFSVTVNWNDFMLTLQRMIDRLETFHNFITDNVCISPESAIKEFFKKTLEVET